MVGQTESPSPRMWKFTKANHDQQESYAIMNHCSDRHPLSESLKGKPLSKMPQK